MAWSKTSTEVMLKAVTAKFSQNATAMTALVATSNRVLGEASPDPFWGTGSRLSSKDALASHMWSGKNNMGHILMKVRDTLSK